MNFHNATQRKNKTNKKKTKQKNKNKVFLINRQRPSKYSYLQQQLTVTLPFWHSYRTEMKLELLLPALEIARMA